MPLRNFLKYQQPQINRYTSPDIMGQPMQSNAFRGTFQKIEEETHHSPISDQNILLQSHQTETFINPATGQIKTSISPKRERLNFERREGKQSPNWQVHTSYSYQDQETIEAYNTKELHQQKQFEWGFGRNLNGELSLGVCKNALVPACALGLTEISTK